MTKYEFTLILKGSLELTEDIADELSAMLPVMAMFVRKRCKRCDVRDTREKVRYVHENPVRRDRVDRPTIIRRLP